MIMDAGRLASPFGRHTVAWQGQQGVGSQGRWGCPWGPPCPGLGQHSHKGSSVLDSKSCLDSPGPMVTLIPT